MTCARDIRPSTVGDSFDPEANAVDVLVEFDIQSGFDYFGTYFDLKTYFDLNKSLERILGHPVDAVSVTGATTTDGGVGLPGSGSLARNAPDLLLDPRRPGTLEAAGPEGLRRAGVAHRPEHPFSRFREISGTGALYLPGRDPTRGAYR